MSENKIEEFFPNGQDMCLTKENYHILVRQITGLITGLDKANDVIEAAKEIAAWKGMDTGAYDNSGYVEYISDMKRLVEALKTFKE